MATRTSAITSRGPRAFSSLVAVALVASVALTGCAGTTEQYCAEVESEREALQELAGSTDAGSLDRTLEVFERLREEAPDDVVDEWDTVIFSLETLRDALAEAGVDAGDFSAGGPPDDVTEEELRAIEDAAQQLRSEPVTDAGQGLEQHARDVCGVDLAK